MTEYIALKTLHIIAIISWMAGLLYLPRLFVYHASAKRGGELDTTLQMMERKLLRFIMNPAMIISFASGLYLVHVLGGFKAIGGWMHLKLSLVLLMAACHGMMSKYRKVFAAGQNQKSHKFFRWFNEAPTVLMIGIVYLVVAQSF